MIPQTFRLQHVTPPQIVQAQLYLPRERGQNPALRSGVHVANDLDGRRAMYALADLSLRILCSRNR